MNYSNIYTSLVERAQQRSIDGYVERHHVIPKCMGGSNKRENLVDLTPEEHYVAHQLLVKMYPDNTKLVFAANMMTMGNSRNNKSFGWIRRKVAGVMSSRMVTDSTKAKLSANAVKRIQERGHPRGMLNKQHSTEARGQMSVARKGSGNGMYGKRHTLTAIEKMKQRVVTDVQRQHLSAQKTGDKHWNYGKELSAETKHRISIAQHATPTITCPHCTVVGKKSPMMRWHFEKCKHAKGVQV